jgi:hypothetical protein
LDDQWWLIFILYLTVKVLHEWYLYFTLKLYVLITYLSTSSLYSPRIGYVPSSKSFSPKFRKLRGKGKLYRLSFRGVFERKKLPITTTEYLLTTHSFLCVDIMVPTIFATLPLSYWSSFVSTCYLESEAVAHVINYYEFYR